MRQTSLLAWESIQKISGKKRMQVYGVIKGLGSATDKEIAKRLGIPINSVTPRRGELVKQGFVIEKERRTDPYTNKLCIYWGVR